MDEKQFLSTREVAKLININEKLVYGLINEKGLPATKVTGKWLFPLQLVEQWLENETINHPRDVMPLPPYHGLLIITGSNDILLDKTIALFNTLHDEHLAVFASFSCSRWLEAMWQRC